MTTPMRYLAFWFIKNKTDSGFNKEYSSKLSYICLSIDNLILEKIRGEANMRDAYLDYFCSFADFNSLSLDLEISPNEEFFVNSVREVFDIKFPMERSKLVKMWNLKPKGISI